MNLKFGCEEVKHIQNWVWSFLHSCWSLETNDVTLWFVPSVAAHSFHSFTLSSSSGVSYGPVCSGLASPVLSDLPAAGKWTEWAFTDGLQEDREAIDAMWRRLFQVQSCEDRINRPGRAGSAPQVLTGCSFRSRHTWSHDRSHWTRVRVDSPSCSSRTELHVSCYWSERVGRQSRTRLYGSASAGSSCCFL